MKREKEPKYYRIRVSVLWSTVIVVVLCIWGFYKVANVNNRPIITEYKDTEKIEYGTISSQLKNIDECCLCGNSSRSLMGYYRKFDTVGIIGLNEWYVLDLRLKEYDEKGNELIKDEHSSTLFGNSQGVDYYINSTPSRGMAAATISSDNGMFNEKVIRENLWPNISLRDLTSKPTSTHLVANV